MRTISPNLLRIFTQILISVSRQSKIASLLGTLVFSLTLAVALLACEQPEPTAPPTLQLTSTSTPTVPPRPTYTETPVPFSTPTPAPTVTPYPTYTPFPTPTPLPTHTPQPTFTPFPTQTPLATYTPTATSTSTPTTTPTYSRTPTITPTPTVTPTPTLIPWPTAIPTDTPTPQPTVEVEEPATPTPTPTATRTPEANPLPPATTAGHDLQIFARDAFNGIKDCCPEAHQKIVNSEWHRDGLTPEEMALIVILAPMARNGDPTFDDFIRVPINSSGVVNLPLAGDVNIWVVRDRLHEPDVDNVATVGRALTFIEGLLGVPFPLTDVILGVNDERTDEGYVRGGLGFVAVNWSSHMTATRFDQQSDAEYAKFINHETSHFYRYHSKWFDEAVSILMEALAGEHQGTTTVAEDAAIARENAEQCIEEGLVDIRHSIYLDAGFWYYGISRCTYGLGSDFMFRLHDLMGRDALVEGIKDAMVPHGEQGLSGLEAETKIHQSLRSNVPRARLEEFDEIYDRYYGGVPFEGPSDDHGDTIQDATPLRTKEEKAGRLDYSFDHDYFQFVSKQDTLYRIDVTFDGLPANHVLVYHEDGGGSAWKSREETTTGVLLRWNSPANGPHYVSVHSFNGLTGPYTVRIEELAAVPDDHSNTWEDATEVELGTLTDGDPQGGWVEGVIDSPTDVDYFKYRAEKGDTIGMEMVYGETEIVDDEGWPCCVSPFDPDNPLLLGEAGGWLIQLPTGGWQYFAVVGYGSSTGYYKMQVLKSQ